MTKIQITEKNFDSGFRGEYKGYHIDTRLITMPQPTSPIFCKIAGLQSYKLINASIFALELFDSIVYLNKQIENIYLRHSQLTYIRNIFELNNEKENIIHIMKRILDDIILVLYVYYDNKNIEKDGKMHITSIGELNNSNCHIEQKIKEALNYDKFKYLFEAINDIHNAYKHSCLMKGAHMEIAKEGVMLSAYYAKYGNINSIYYLRHNLMHIIVGFSDFLLAFTRIEMYNRQCTIVETKREATI